ncbi:prepilin-type N-terminal cleavage/methylation domain-containing protein [Lentisphaera marina]|uniref:prepilin-type N-terminal cleavage/methylation domain-containing protein n=1 Tax=Lentisphaera marina TaxID=1111041 RepID=UPI0023671471|nr:prepilin-type N-terminal cleavage/methylation domain-containing protein [Lentisphaera marina]MDD7985383.1 prepilin-type N-terminal cleavage/methylation domain-containing protein [Lentisphaera marina]
MSFYKKHFSLIEILVVVAIIGILASLLLPSLSKARKSAQLASCKSQIKQINFALYNYLDDNNQYFVFGKKNSSSLIVWDDELFDYLGVSLSDNEKDGVKLNRTDYPQFTKKSPYKCPADNIVRDSDRNPRSYVYNVANTSGRFGFSGLSTTWGESIKISTIGKSSEVLTFMQDDDHEGKSLGANGHAYMGTQ